VRFSLPGRLALLVIANAIAAALLAVVAVRVFDRLGGSGLLAFVTALAIVIPLGVWSARAASDRFMRTLTALGDGMRSFRDRDFSMRLAARGDDELSEIVRVYNDVGEILRARRNDVYQKELLLDTILQGTPIAVVLTNPSGRVVYSNSAARELLAGGTGLDGRDFREIAGSVVEPMRGALLGGGDALLTIAAGDDQEETFHLVQRRFFLNTQRHTLLMLERLTPELRRQEVNVWKKAIRTLNHELNNSLAPVSSLVHSARHVQAHPEHADRLDDIYATIEERLQHLRSFLEGYAQFARLPSPRKQRVSWSEILDELRDLYPFRVDGRPRAEGTFDRAQMQQVLINLLKNAAESGSPAEEIVVSVEPSARGVTLRVADRGRGMESTTMRQALLPFYSTKATGTGLGLAICNEIVDAHGGRLTLHAREGGGTVVTCWLPD
jgi:two-component system, NtrC family, nitrogen regulation sensor histidine kinase NtrY